MNKTTLGKSIGVSIVLMLGLFLLVLGYFVMRVIWLNKVEVDYSRTVSGWVIPQNGDPSSITVRVKSPQSVVSRANSKASSSKGAILNFRIDATRFHFREGDHVSVDATCRSTLIIVPIRMSTICTVDSAVSLPDN